MPAIFIPSAVWAMRAISEGVPLIPTARFDTLLTYLLKSNIFITNHPFEAAFVGQPSNG
jgi:hypothetical protein